MRRSTRGRSTPADDLGLTQRSREILEWAISTFVTTRQPVGSRKIARRSREHLSAATVRNILAHLEEQGLVRQRHTSAGRVPTDSGYRFYVDYLLGSRKRTRSLPEIEARLRQAAMAGDMLENVSQELSRASHHVAFAITPAA